MLFDTHAHYDASQFDQDREELLENLPKEGVSYLLNPGCDLESSETAVAFAQKYAHVYAGVGYHPSEVLGVDLEKTLVKLRELAQNPKVKAIGEIGLDYYWEDNAPKEVQQAFFHGQMSLAEELLLPVIIHDREAHADSLEVVQAHPGLRGVFHCFSGSVEMAKQLLDLGYYLSFTGVITYKNARKTLEVVDYVPLERIMLETDSPYLSPEPRRGRRNDSRNLQYINRCVAERKGISEEECGAITLENSKKFFNIL